MEKFTAIYARQSVDKKDSISIEGQIELCRREAIGEVQIYQDKGYSGKNVKRPAFTQLMDDVVQGRVSKVVCYRLDRISRSITDFGLIWDVFSATGVEFVSVNEKFDTATPVGRAMLYIIMVFAQLERETIAERIKDNYYQRVRNGTWPGGPAPYGFEIVKEKGVGSVLAATDRIQIVPQLFEMYAEQGASLGTVSLWLNENKIPGAQRPNWDTVSLCRLLRHPAYAKADATVYAYYKKKGMIMANDIEEFDGIHGAIIIGKRLANERKYTRLDDHLLTLSGHQGIIDAELFLACQHKLDSNKQIKNTGKGKYTWLSGLLKCGECGYSLKVLNDIKTQRRRLCCSGRTNLHLCSHRHSERLDNVEATVEASIIAHMLDPAHRKPEPVVNAGELKASLAVIDDKISNLIQALVQASPVTMTYINAEMDKLEAEKNNILSQLSQSTSQAPDSSPFEFIDFSVSDFETKKKLAHSLIDKVVCTSEKTEIIWK